jgi:hypothetical protein
MTLRVGCARKRGQPGFGSVGASCGLDLELDGGLFDREPEALRQRIRAAFDACRDAVAEELDAHAEDEPIPGPPPDPNSRNGHPPRPGPARRTDEPTPAPVRNGRPASEKQVKAIRAIARRNGADLATILRQDHGVDRPEELTVVQASSLIDALKGDAVV